MENTLYKKLEIKPKQWTIPSSLVFPSKLGLSFAQSNSLYDYCNLNVIELIQGSI